MATLENLMQNRMLEFSLVTQLQVKLLKFSTKKGMVVEESIHAIFYEYNNSLQKRESVDDDLGLDTYMGRLEIENRGSQEKNEVDPKEERSPLTLLPPQQVQGESISLCMF